MHRRTKGLMASGWARMAGGFFRYPLHPPRAGYHGGYPAPTRRGTPGRSPDPMPGGTGCKGCANRITVRARVVPSVIPNARLRSAIWADAGCTSLVHTARLRSVIRAKPPAQCMDAEPRSVFRRMRKPPSAAGTGRSTEAQRCAERSFTGAMDGAVHLHPIIKQVRNRTPGVSSGALGKQLTTAPV